MYKNHIKRLLDFILAAMGIIVLSPLIAVVSILVRVKLGSPIVFKQPRPGKNEKIFYLYKFRSMTNATDENGMLLPDKERLTRFGRFLRSSSIDELLELVNILKGEMSIVGPRPLSIHYLPHYSPETRKRHEVRPGLTGLAQINGRNNLGWEDRFALDVQYVNNVTFLGDIKIIIGTVMKVLKASDISVRGTNAVKDFGPYSMIKEVRNTSVKRDGMTYSEIGSFFWLDKKSGDDHVGNFMDRLPEMGDAVFTFSGRSAIEIAIRNIVAERKVRTAYLPSYCCVSMVQPFIDHGIKVKFYDVSYRDGRFRCDVSAIRDDSIVLVMNYFGFHAEDTHRVIESLPQSTVVIEDITHSLLSENSYSRRSDYLVAALRKWFAIPTGGWVGKKTGILQIKPDMESNHTVEGKIKGMMEKAAYMNGEIAEKDGFLDLQTKFETDLIHVDPMLKIDDTSLRIVTGTDVQAVAERRRKNVEMLRSGLKDLDGGVLEMPDVDLTVDTPLFLPVLMKTEDRDDLRRYLIERGIYLPIHWPEIMGAPVGVRANELSLVCDQRYADGDMQAIVDEIHAWWNDRGEKRQ